jgi:arginyl-tRNA synthetase
MTKQTVAPQSLDALMEEAKADLAFDMTTAEHVSVKVPFLTEKYARKLVFAKASLRKAEMDMNEVYAERLQHYITSHNIRIDRRDLDTYVKGDKEYNQAVARMETKKLEVEYLQAIMSALDKLSWNVGNAIKLWIWKQGGR